MKKIIKIDSTKSFIDIQTEVGEFLRENDIVQKAKSSLGNNLYVDINQRGFLIVEFIGE